MTELLQQALEKLSDLPVEKQEIIARLILQEIEQDEANISEENNLPEFVGIGKSGRKDLSSRTDELLWQDK